MSLSACGVLGVRFYTVPSGPGRFRRLPFPVAARWSFPMDDRQKRKGRVLWTRLFSRSVAWLSRWNVSEHSCLCLSHLFSCVCISGNFFVQWIRTLGLRMSPSYILSNKIFISCVEPIFLSLLFTLHFIVQSFKSLHKSWARPSFSLSFISLISQVYHFLFFLFFSLK